MENRTKRDMMSAAKNEPVKPAAKLASTFASAKPASDDGFGFWAMVLCTSQQLMQPAYE